ncbi:MAG: alpha/beta fold hydrolase [Thermoflexales bacterium]
MNYENAITRARRVVEAETEAINPVCRTRLMVHPAQAAQSVLFFHGLTSCPRQFEPLGKILFERGWNVYIPRMPFHGYADKMTGDLARLRKRDLIDWAAESADIAAGLGERAVVAGLSVGGACAAWVAQNVAAVDRAVVISPFLRTPAVPAGLTRPAAALFGLLPNQWRWWDPMLKDARSAPDFSYPRLATRAVAAALGLSMAVMDGAQQRAAAVKKVTLVLNENDKVVDNAAIRELHDQWYERGVDARLYVFGRESNLPHDLIGAEHPEQHVDVVYPVVLKLIEE